MSLSLGAIVWSEIEFCYYSLSMWVRNSMEPDKLALSKTETSYLTYKSKDLLP